MTTAVTLRARRRRLATVALAMTMLAASAAVSGPLDSTHRASAQTSFTVTVHADSVFGGGPGFMNAFSPPLPPDWTRTTGPFGCLSVIVSGVTRPVAEVSGQLDAGQYQLTDCEVPSEVNVVIPGVGIQNLSAQITAIGGIYRVNPAESELDVEVFHDIVGGTIDVTAAVELLTGEDLFVEGAVIHFAYEDRFGVYTLVEGECPLVTAFDPDFGFASAECQIPATNVLPGTGEWMASFDGTTNVRGSAVRGTLDGAETDPVQAAFNFSQRTDIVEIVQEFIPPGCYMDSGVNASLLMVSISVVSQNCAALRALTVTTAVVLALIPVGKGAGGLIVKAIAKTKSAAAKAAVKSWNKIQMANQFRPI